MNLHSNNLGGFGEQWYRRAWSFLYSFLSISFSTRGTLFSLPLGVQFLRPMRKRFNHSFLQKNGKRNFGRVRHPILSLIILGVNFSFVKNFPRLRHFRGHLSLKCRKLLTICLKLLILLAHFAKVCSYKMSKFHPSKTPATFQAGDFSAYLV